MAHKRLVRFWWFEAVLAGLLAITALVVDRANNQSWQTASLDLAAYLAAGLTTRWPRAAGVALLAILSLYLVIPPGWATMGEYAALVPVLGAGRQGALRIRTAMAVAYYVVLLAIAWREAPTPTSAMLGWTGWTLLITFAWLLGDAFRLVTRAYEQDRVAALVRQRNAVTRDLHDTSARSLTELVMAAERLKSRGTASQAELDHLATIARKSIRDLRLVMQLLREEKPEVPLSVDRTVLGEALEAAVAELTRHGFQVGKVVDGELATLAPRVAATLGAVTQEAAHNIVKHGDPRVPCAIIVVISGDGISITFRNGRVERSGSADHTASFGLWGMSQQLQEIGGEVDVESTPTHWITRVNLPRHTPAGPITSEDQP